MTEPWVAVEATIRRSPKMTGLPNDTARYGWIVALGEAKLLQRAGAFLPGQWDEVMGRYTRHRAEYVSAGLLHVVPFICPDARCMKGRGPYPDGTLVIHKWGVYQREHALRQADYLARQSDAQSDAASDVPSDAESDSLSRALSHVHSPVSSTTSREPYQVGDGIEEPYRTLEQLTQFAAQRVEPNAIRTLDALCDRRGIPAVLAALRAEAPGIDPQPPAPWPLIAAVRNRLEPFAGPKKPEVIGKGGVSAEEAERAFGIVR